MFFLIYLFFVDVLALTFVFNLHVRGYFESYCIYEIRSVKQYSISKEINYFKLLNAKSIDAGTSKVLIPLAMLNVRYIYFISLLRLFDVNLCFGIHFVVSGEGWDINNKTIYMGPI